MGPGLSIHPGRQLRLGPDWQDDDACLVFDDRSGDFWVVTRPARELLERLIAGGPPVEPEVGDTNAPMVAELVAQKLIVGLT